MEWNNFYVIIIIALIFVFVIALMFIVPKLLPTGKESTYELTTISHLAPYNSQKELKRVKAWQKKNPPNTEDYVVGVSHDWHFEILAPALVENTTTLLFPDQPVPLSLMANQTLPMSKPIIYWEATMVELTRYAALGLSTKAYPSWRLPGWHTYSIAYHSYDGCVYVSNSRAAHAYGPGFKQDDVIGVGYLTQSKTVFFTKNGRNLGRAITGFKFPVYPCIGAIGKCKITVNFGQQAFRYDSANVWQAGLIRDDNLPSPPPIYGGHIRDTLVFDQPSYISLNMSPPDDLTPTDPNVSSPPPQYSRQILDT
ncbi:concanavalin A-like lectin/glucanase domain-containing protein [Chlamydoabsidia padenii]|nr:concanavalin A-like lectin/glucanase domain-containing protein [Chlamydoabsidia padenii]